MTKNKSFGSGIKALPNEQVKSSWLSKVFSFSWIGSWWSGKGAKVEPQDKAVLVETKNEEPEAETGSGSDVSLQPSGSNPNTSAQPVPTSWLSIFSNILSFVGLGSKAKSDGQLVDDSGKELAGEQTPEVFTKWDLQKAITLEHDYNKVSKIIKLHPKLLYPKIGDHLPLRYAICFGSKKPDKTAASLQIVEFLVDEMQKEGNLKASDNSGHLTFAVKCSQIGMVKFFVEEYSPVISSACLLAAAEQKAVQDNHSGEILEFLLKQNIDQEVLDDALRQVARQKTKGDGYEMYNEAVQALIEKGANINSQDEDGKTALHIAIYYDKFSTIEILLNNNACHDIKNTKGITPIAFMNEKLLLSQEYLSNANDDQDVVCDLNQNTARAEERIERYNQQCKKWHDLIALCSESSGVEEESGDDVLVHNLDGVGDSNLVLVDNLLLNNNVEDFPALYPESGVFGDLNGSLFGNSSLLLTNAGN